MASLAQKWMPGIVGISTYVDFVYHREMQLAFVAAAGTPGPINQLRAVTVTLDFDALIKNVRAGRIEAAEEQVASTVAALAGAGADFVVVTSGTTSTLTARARRRVAVPFLDLADCACLDPAALGRASIGLLSTSHAARGGIFQAAAERRGARLITPPPAMAERVDTVVFDELISGRVTEAGVGVLGEAIAALADDGAEAVILGNTDMTLAAQRLEETARVPLIDAARAHARAAARAAIDGHL